jgi:hypothetical protein
MRKQFLLLALVFVGVFAANAQDGEKLKVITGVRVNPLLIYDLEGGVKEKVLLHGELGALFNKRIYTSLGYTAAVNAVYNFNEYWFIGFDKKVPVSWVIAEEYNLNNNKFYIQTGPNIKLNEIGNVFAFLFTPTDQFKLGLKVGVFIPLNVVLYKK